jgi:hypothetical protein
MLSGSLLFRSLETSYAGYYKSIGEPVVFALAKLTDTERSICAAISEV